MRSTRILSLVGLLALMCPIGLGDAAIAQQAGYSGNAIPVEYSNVPDEERDEACSHGNADPAQVLYTEPADATGCPFVRNALDFGGQVDVDAIASCQDAYFNLLRNNSTQLVVSFNDDLPDPPGWAVYYETPAGMTGARWRQAALCRAGATDGSVEDVDGIELWGPVGGDDAVMYSLVGEPGGISVFGPGGVPYISRSQIHTAISSLGFQGEIENVDLDALMVKDVACDGEFGAGDEIMFSIRAAANWDGGEIVVYPFSAAPVFLSHGGHVWDTGHPVAIRFGCGTEEVDAIESWLVPGVPATSYRAMVIFALVLISAAAVLFGRRLRRA
jgi:hypothetical protein